MLALALRGMSAGIGKPPHGLVCPAVANRRQDVSVAGGASDRQALIARVGLYLAVAYITLTTSDVDIVRVPLKLFVVAFALIGWLTVHRPWSRPRRSYGFAVPVLVGGILIPIAWFALALLLHHRHDPAQPANTSYAIQQASRFVYLLLYFPILDEVRRCAAIASARPRSTAAHPPCLVGVNARPVWDHAAVLPGSRSARARLQRRQCRAVSGRDRG